MLLRTSVAAVAFVLLAAPSAASHSGVPVSWWLDEPTAFSKSRAVMKPRYQPAAFKTFTGRCEGAAPRKLTAAGSVFKHFDCLARLQVNGIGYTFVYTLHVTGPRGRVQVGE